MYLKQYEPAADCFKRANAIQRHDERMQLGKVYTLQEEYKTAIEVYLEALGSRRRIRAAHDGWAALPAARRELQGL